MRNSSLTVPTLGTVYHANLWPVARFTSPSSKSNPTASHYDANNNDAAAANTGAHSAAANTDANNSESYSTSTTTDVRHRTQHLCKRSRLRQRARLRQHRRPTTAVVTTSPALPTTPGSGTSIATTTTATTTICDYRNDRHDDRIRHQLCELYRDPSSHRRYNKHCARCRHCGWRRRRATIGHCCCSDCRRVDLSQQTRQIEPP
jgi:hypothetical protein